jgi:hypothetical protein
VIRTMMALMFIALAMPLPARATTIDHSVIRSIGDAYQFLRDPLRQPRHWVQMRSGPQLATANRVMHRATTWVGNLRGVAIGFLIFFILGLVDRLFPMWGRPCMDCAFQAIVIANSRPS